MQAAQYAHRLHIAIKDNDETEELRDTAIECYEYAAELVNRDSAARIYSNLGSLYKEKGEFDRALKAYELSLARDGSSAATYFNMGNLRYKMKDYDIAEEAFKEAIRIDPFYYKPRVSLGWLLQGQHRFKEAKAQHREALKSVDPTSKDAANIYANLGIIYHQILSEDNFPLSQTSASDDAEYYYRLALEIDIDQKEANKCLPLLQSRNFDEFNNVLSTYFPKKKKKGVQWVYLLFLLFYIFLIFYIF